MACFGKSVGLNCKKRIPLSRLAEATRLLRHFLELFLAGPLSFVPLSLLALESQQTAVTTPSASNLLEYGCVPFSDEGAAISTVPPPELKVFEDGRVIFSADRRLFESHFKPQALMALRRTLNALEVLQAEQLLEGYAGRPLLVHGGVCYFRKGHGADETVLTLDVSYPPESWGALSRESNARPATQQSRTCRRPYRYTLRSTQ